MPRPNRQKSVTNAFAGFACLSLVALSVGCNFLPDVRHKPQYHNPFPQISKVAILPFRNQSEDPTISGERVSLAYYNELQSIPGFEVLPVGVVDAQIAGFEEQVLRRPMSRPEDFQQFANYIGVDSVLQGSITDYDAYYPPRMTLKVNWYAANEGYHPIPPGYGLPWGTKAEKKIPESIRLEAERTLAREQLKTQTPVVETRDDSRSAAATESQRSNRSRIVRASTEGEDSDEQLPTVAELQIVPPEAIREGASESHEPLPMESIEAVKVGEHSYIQSDIDTTSLPTQWPDPQGFIPPSPKSTRPVAQAQSLPVISHMKAYNGNDEDFTEQLSDYYYFRDDARFGGWEAYLQRSEDFIRFCCHQHIVETLAARGGQLESRTVVRWPINRYER
jgi:hypothetical protein